MTKRILLCLPLLMTLACDADEDTTEARSAELQSEQVEPGDEPDGDHHGPSGHAKMLDRLCDELECSDDQRAAIGQLVVAAKRDHEGPDADARAAMHEALATAFRSDTFDASALPQPSDDHHAARRTEMATLLVGIHAILTTEQRDALADKVESGEGPLALLGHGKPHGKHGKGKGKKGGKGEQGGEQGEGREFDPAEHAERKVAHLCELVTCSEDQQAKLETVVADAMADMAPPAPPQVDDATKAKLAAALRADSLTVAELEPLLDAMRPAKPDKHAQMGELLASIHAVLTAEQRGIVADELAEQGPRALMGKGPSGKGGKRHGKRR
jgi:Spy/CpxP family protein refolding chaperone